MADFGNLARALSFQQQDHDEAKKKSTKRKLPGVNEEDNRTSLKQNSFSIKKIKSVQRNINTLPEKILFKIFSYLTPNQLLDCSLVCKQWRNLTQNSKVWKLLRLRPYYYDSIAIKSQKLFMNLLHSRFSQSLEYIELSVEHITVEMLHQLANKCNYLTNLVLDFSTAMQLHDFNDLNVFPCNLKMLTIFLSDVIFLEGFMRKIYSFLSSIEQLHLIGTYERSIDLDESYETLNIIKLKQYTPNLRLINFYGISFLDDSHIEALALNCVHLETVALNYCIKFKGYSLASLLSKCKKIKTLLLQNTSIENKAIKSVEWSETQIKELDLTSTDLDEETLILMMTQLNQLRYLSVASCDGFTDNTLNLLDQLNLLGLLEVLDISNTVNITPETVFSFIKKYGHQFKGFSYTGNPKVNEQFWINSIKYLKNIRVIILGTTNGWFKRILARIHINLIIDNFANRCPFLERLEIQWDQNTISHNYNSRKYIDLLRIRCNRLKSFVLSDGEFYEMVKSSFERADRKNVVRTTASYLTSCVCLLENYAQLQFN